MKKQIAFTKMHGTGNDFIVIDNIRNSVKITLTLARHLCDRRFGVGADQILILGKSRKADFLMRILNADGSEVEMCGNGIRCVALYAYKKGHIRKKEMTFETMAGIIRVSLGKNQVRVDMGPPVLEAKKIPTKGKDRVIEHPFRWNGKKVKLTSVSMGNPHAIIFVKDLEKTSVAEWGAQIEKHPFFPKRVNVEFVQVKTPKTALVRVWERGSGITMACGTGACAVGVAGVLTGRFHREVTLSLPGGNLTVQWGVDNRVYLTGRAAFVYEGIY